MARTLPQMGAAVAATKAAALLAAPVVLVAILVAALGANFVARVMVDSKAVVWSVEMEVLTVLADALAG